jgi:LacI family transcriptional regulator
MWPSDIGSSTPGQRHPGGRRHPAVSMITIRDVARAAGVSVATVSRVQNGSALVKETTRQRVGEVVRRLGYAPHPAARTLITSRTSTIGVLLPDLYGEFFSEVIRGIDQTAQGHGFHLLVSSSHDETEAVRTVLRSMRGRVDGLIIMWPELDESMLPNLPAGFPVVLLSAPLGTSSFDVIRVANFEGAYDMVSHLLQLGHRDVGILRGAEGNADASERLRGYRAALLDNGIEPGPFEAAGAFTEESGFYAARDLLRGEVIPTAIFAANDAMAIGALSALREAGLHVPTDVALAGFDDIPMARYMDPPLSTVRVDISALGERATTRLLTAVRDREDHTPRIETLPTTLVLRGSSQPASPVSHPASQSARPAPITVTSLMRHI